MKPNFAVLVAVTCLLAQPSPGAELKWTGMRIPPKVSAGDGITQLGTKIGTFTTLSKEEIANTVFNVNNRFPNSRPWATWAVGVLPDATTFADAVHNEYLAHMNSLGVDIFLEIYPRRANTNVVETINEWLGKLKQHPNVKGFGIDLEYYQRVDDATARAWLEAIKGHNAQYRMFLKHWDERFMPPAYRGNGDIIFINTSSEATVEALNDEYVKFAAHFAPSPCAFQVGYPADEDGMDGRNDKGWWKLEDPIKDWGTALINKIEHPTQEIGLLWVCVKSGKTYNTGWDLTKGAKLPR